MSNVGGFKILSPAGGKLSPTPVAGYLTAVDLTSSPPQCAGQVDTSGCAQRQTPRGATFAFLTGGERTALLSIKGVRYVPLSGTCFLGDWKDFHVFPGGDHPIARAPLGYLSKSRFQLTQTLNLTGKLTSFDGTTSSRLTITVSFRKAVR